MTGVIGVIGWWAYVVRYEAREMWRALPGPWPVKVLLIIACQAIPGPFDEVAVIAIAAARRRRAQERGTR